MSVGKSTVNSVVKAASSLGNAAVSLFSALMSALLILYGGYALYDTIYTQNQAYASSWDLLKYRPEIIDDNANPLTSALAAKNPDYRAWLTMYETGIDYPVMQGKDDLYYASHDVFKKNSLTGALYLSHANKANFSDNYNMIYGHHMDANALFGTLDRFTDKTYAKNHREGILVTKDSVYDLNVFAVLKTDAYDGSIYNVGTRNLGELISYIQSKQIYFNATTANSATKVLAMSTCEKATTNGRLIVFAKMTKRDLSTPPVATVDNTNPQGTVPNGTTPTLTAQTAEQPQPGATPTTTTTQTTTPAATPEQAATPQAQKKQKAEPETIADDENPLAGMLRPTGGSYDKCWALLNFICMLASLFMLIPLGSLGAKYSRAKKMREANAEGADYDEKRFARRLMIGAALEVAVCIAAVVVYFLTEDMTTPMALIDMWTPLMIVFPLVALIIDIRLARYRTQDDDSQDDDTDSATMTPQPAGV